MKRIRNVIPIGMECKTDFRKISDDESAQQNAEIKMLDFWFHKNSCNNMNLNLSREGIDGTYCYTMSK